MTSISVLSDSALLEETVKLAACELHAHPGYFRAFLMASPTAL